MEKVKKHNTAFINGCEIAFYSECEDYPIQNEEGNEVGSVFVYAYVREDEAKERPLLFAFNGGPGSSSLWLHMGILGPKHPCCDDIETLTGSGNYKIEDNPYSPLDVCDIVILDPVGTGFGTEKSPEAAQYAYGFVNDARVMADIIERWITRHKRFKSKKYLMAESYGSVRSVAVANYLMGGCIYEGGVAKGIAIDGIINLGNVILRESDSSDYTEKERGLEESISLLPSYAATAWFHGERKGSLQDIMERAYRFCSEVYVRALYLGNRLPQNEKEYVANELSDMTGIDEQILLKHNLRITSDNFLHWFQEKNGVTISPYDTRFTGNYTPDLNMHDLVGDDEMMSRCMHGFLGAFHEICEKELGLETDRLFQVINFNVNANWSYSSNYTPFEMLQFLLNRSKKFRIFIGNGVFDLVTSVGQVAYTVSQLKYDKNQVIVKEYPAGHMPYLGEHGGEELASDIRRFINEGEKNERTSN